MFNFLQRLKDLEKRVGRIEDENYDPIGDITITPFGDNSYLCKFTNKYYMKKSFLAKVYDETLIKFAKHQNALMTEEVRKKLLGKASDA